MDICLVLGPLDHSFDQHLVTTQHREPLGPSGLLDFVLWALRPCDRRNGAVSLWIVSWPGFSVSEQEQQE